MHGCHLHFSREIPNRNYFDPASLSCMSGRDTLALASFKVQGFGGV